MAPDGRMGQMEMKCMFDIKYFYMGQGFSVERCGPWASCLWSFAWHFKYSAYCSWMNGLTSMYFIMSNCMHSYTCKHYLQVTIWPVFVDIALVPWLRSLLDLIWQYHHNNELIVREWTLTMFCYWLMPECGISTAW
jgi:hypothetical protein